MVGSLSLYFFFPFIFPLGHASIIGLVNRITRFSRGKILVSVILFLTFVQERGFCFSAKDINRNGRHRQEQQFDSKNSNKLFHDNSNYQHA